MIEKKYTMNFYLILIGLSVMVMSSSTIHAQTNTFPDDGNVGIGTLTPSQKLYVVGNSIIGVNNIDSILNGEGYFQSNSSIAGAGFVATPWVYARAIEGDQRGSGSTLITIGSQNGFTGNDQIGFVTNGNMRMFVGTSGRVGIGTINPSVRLTVNGTTKTKEIIVDENIGADFVFEQDYELTELSSLEKFIRTNRHLPEIPTAQKMMRDGIKVGNFQMKLLQKIEELTLYIIEISKDKNEMERSLNKKITLQKKRLKELELKIAETIDE